ncbi:MAG: hypothetical protein ACHQ50_11575 [Fimbriimonadales bacterium]
MARPSRSGQRQSEERGDDLLNGVLTATAYALLFNKDYIARDSPQYAVNFVSDKSILKPWPSAVTRAHGRSAWKPIPLRCGRLRADVHAEDGIAFHADDRAQIGLDGEGVNGFA